MIAWFNGELLPLNGISISATDRGFLLGDGIFETMAVNAGHIARFEDHMERLQTSADMLGLPISYSRKEIADAIQEVLVGCQLTDLRAAVRLTVSRGTGPRGLLPPLEISPQFLISAAEAPDHFPAANVKTVSVRRNEHSPTANIKSLCYMDNIFALQEAKKLGGDEALLLNTAGHIAEASIANIFFIEDNILFTPKIGDGVLPGTMRDTVLTKARDLGMDVREESLPADIIQTCDEAFLTNSLIRVRLIHEIDGRLMPSDEWTHRLLDAVKADEA